MARFWRKKHFRIKNSLFKVLFWQYTTQMPQEHLKNYIHKIIQSKTFEMTKNNTAMNNQFSNKKYIFSLIYLFKKLLFTMENATAAGSSQSNISRIYIWKDKTAKLKYILKWPLHFLFDKTAKLKYILKWLLHFK